MSSNSIALARLRAKLAAASEELVNGIRKEIRSELETVVRELHTSGQNVDGTAWANRRKRSGGGLALQSIIQTTEVVIDGESVVVRITHPKAKFQQGGWTVKSGRRTQGRLMMPGRNRVGKMWLNAIRRASDRVLRRAARAAK